MANKLTPVEQLKKKLYDIRLESEDKKKITKEELYKKAEKARKTFPHGYLSQVKPSI